MKLCPKCQKQFSDDANFCPVDAARLVPLETQNQGSDTLSARFDLGPRLGGSRTGAVHRAVDKTTGQACVVKLVAPAVVALPGVAQRLERELKQLERVKSVGVAHVIASGKRGEETWLATELVEGAQTLAEAIGARGPLPANQAADLIEVIGEALIEAAQVGVVHRDLAPKNILFTGQDLKLINFSLPVPTSDKVPGVHEFVAPEQIDGRPVDQRSNLYSLGALYYYALTGQPVGSGDIRPPSQLAPMPAAVDAVILRALDKSPTKRFLTVRQFVDEVTRVGHGDVVELKQPAAPKPAGGRPKAELMQTLIGVARFAPGNPIASAPTVDTPMQAVAPQGIPMPQPLPPQAVQSAPPAMPPPQAASPDPRSVWAAPPGSPAPAQMPAAPVVAAPAVAAPVVAAPVVAAPVVAAQPKPAAAGKADDKGKFRETMWFKKGDLDAQAAVAAAEERARTGKDSANDKADSKAMDERYTDDGSITRGDKEKYSLRTGATQMMPSMAGHLDPRNAASQSMSKVSEDALIGEMKGLPMWLKAAIGLGVVAVVIVIVVFAAG